VRIVVDPDFWKVGYLVDVGLGGREVEVEHLSHVSLMPAVQTDAEATKFSFALQPAAVAFSFEAHGLSLKLVTLDCRERPGGLESGATAPASSRASPPPPRPVEKVPTLSYDDETSYGESSVYDVSDYDEPGGPAARAAAGAAADAKGPHGAPGPAKLPMSAPTAALMAGLVFFLLAGCLWYKSKSRSHAGYGSTTRTNSKVVSADEEALGGMACCSVHQASWEAEAETPAPRAASEPSTAGRTWKVSVELEGGLSYQLAVPMSAAGPTELKHAIVTECLSNLGADLTPGSWLAGQLDTMAVQYIGAKGEPKTVKETSDFPSVRRSRVLRVTQRPARSHERPPMITATLPPPLGPTVDIMPPVAKPLEI
jgi:hypothetical protein